MQKKIPMRQCVGCREMRPKKELVRVVKSPEGVIRLDFRGKAPGRGAYLCPNSECLKKAIRAKALERAEKTAQTDFETACIAKAAENTTVDMPNALVEKELDIQMERFGYQLQMSGYSMEQYAKMMGGDVNTMRNAFRPAAEKQAKISVTLEAIAKAEGLTATEEEIEEEIKSLAKQYEMEEAKVKEMVPAEELTGSLVTRKAIKLIVDSAVAVAPKAEEKTEG